MQDVSFSDLLRASRGVVDHFVEDGGLVLRRFTKEEMKDYISVSLDGAGLALRKRSTSGVEFVFRTDSDELFVEAVLSQTSSRLFGGAIDVLLDGAFYKSLSIGEVAEGVLSETISLPRGEKTVKLVLPGLYEAILRRVALSVGASFAPVPPKRKMLMYGDSITQGYDAVYPSRTYASQLANTLDAEAVNKAIGGEIFLPSLATLPDGADPDLITVAYGVNDWHRGIRREEYTENARAFLVNLRKKHPKAPIFVLSPIWTGDYENKEPFPFRELPCVFNDAKEGLCDVYVIDCFDFVPHDAAYYMDLVLHPNDEGYDFYAKGVLDALARYGV